MFPVSNHSYCETSTNTVKSSIPRTAVFVCETRIAMRSVVMHPDNAKAQFELSRAYDDGRGVDKSPKKAAHWCSKAALQGDAAALLYLGLMYAHGNGVDKNHATAANYYKLSAEKGYQYAQLTLGDAYATGKGVKKNVVEAAKWYDKAAKQGDAEAAHKLGKLKI